MKRKSFRCEVLDWHKPTMIRVTISLVGLPIQVESVCKRCGRPIMKDSQGNWFSCGDVRSVQDE